MNNLEEYEGMPFPVPDSEIGETCVDYWFDETETEEVTRDSPLVPSGYKAIARDPGDDLLLQQEDGSIHYVRHENGKILLLAATLEAFLEAIETE